MTLAVTTIGDGRDLVLLHGWAMHSGIFEPLTQRLASRFRLHLVDLPGHGHNPAFESGALDPAACASAIAHVTPAAIWLGWSLGGLVALRGALDDPAHVRGLVEIASSPRFVVADAWTCAVPAVVFADFAADLETRFETSIERFLALETLGSPNAHDELRALKAQVFAHGAPSLAALREGLAILDASDLRAEVRQLGVPSLWIAGRRDRLVPPAAMRWAAQQAVDSAYLEIAAGHAPFLSHAEEVAMAIMRFADTVPA